MQETTLKPVTTQSLAAPTLRDLAAVAFRHRSLMIASFLAVFLGAILAALILPKQYEAHLKILVKQERVDPVVTPESNAQQWLGRGMTEEDLNSEVELLKSRDLLEKVVVATNLHMRKGASLLPDWFSGADAQDMRIPLAVRQLEKDLTAEPFRKTRMIDVRYKSSDPQLAAQVLGMLSTLYLEKHLEVHRPAGALGFFQNQTEQYRKDLSDAEARLAGFGREQGVVAAGVEKDLTLRKSNDFEASLRQTQSAMAETTERIQNLEKQVAATPARQTTQVRTSDNPFLLQQMKSTLLNLELKRTELLTKFDPSYRTVQEVEKEIAQTRQALAAAEQAPLKDETTDRDPTHAWLVSELAKARADQTALGARADATSRAVAAYRASARELNQQEIVQQDLQRDAKTAEERYMLYLRKQEEARISDVLDQKRIVNVAIAEAATVPALPSSPKWSLTLILGFLLALMTSVGLAFTVDYLDPSFRTPDEVERYLDVPVLASIPKN